MVARHRHGRERDSIFARPLAFRRMQTFRAVPERGRNLEAVPMTIYALGNRLAQQDGPDIGLEQDRLRVVRESGAVDIFMQVGFEIVMAWHGVLLAAPDLPSVCC